MEPFYTKEVFFKGTTGSDISLTQFFLAPKAWVCARLLKLKTLPKITRFTNEHKIYEIQKKIDNNTATPAERQEQQERIAWNISFRQFLKKTGL